MKHYEHELEAVQAVLRKASVAAMELYARDYTIEEKEDKTPVTEADLRVNTILHEALESFGYGWLSEESKDDGSRYQHEYVWVVDPIDGTKDFIQKTDEFSIMVGLLKNNLPVLGGVAVPAQNALYWAVKSEGAWVERNGEVAPLAVSTIENTEEARMVVSRNHLSEESKQIAERLKVSSFIPTGSVGLKVSSLAENKADIYTNTGFGKSWEWDVCAADIILTEAGGVVTDVDGKTLVYNKNVPNNPRGILATTKPLQAALQEATDAVLHD